MPLNRRALRVAPGTAGDRAYGRVGRALSYVNSVACIGHGGIIHFSDNITLMLGFLVTSKARRRLLQLLWGQDASGSTTDLATRAHVGFASAYRELQAMEGLGLVVTERPGSAEVYRANRAHPLADALGALVAPAPDPAKDDEARELRGQLAALGAPLRHEVVEPLRGSVEETVVRGVRLAHRDADVARTLPVCLYRQRGALDPERLRQFAVRLGEKQALGFFLELTTELSGDRRFVEWMKALRDRRYKVPRNFFYAPVRSRRQHQLAEEKTPRVARRWRLRMNMDLDAFRSTFEKFVTRAAV